MPNVSQQSADVWLNLICRFQTQHNISFAPSATEVSIMNNSQETLADVVTYDPAQLEYLVVSDSTLVWPHKKSRRIAAELAT